jgi:RHS repeat-associated protein
VTDANGTPITDPSHIGNVNPIRYRGYYYDTETGYYYLQSRYYNPE